MKGAASQIRLRNAAITIRFLNKLQKSLQQSMMRVMQRLFFFNKVFLLFKFLTFWRIALICHFHFQRKIIITLQKAFKGLWRNFSQCFPTFFVSRNPYWVFQSLAAPKWWNVIKRIPSPCATMLHPIVPQHSGLEPAALAVGSTYTLWHHRDSKHNLEIEKKWM